MFYHLLSLTKKCIILVSIEGLRFFGMLHFFFPESIFHIDMKWKELVIDQSLILLLILAMIVHSTP